MKKIIFLVITLVFVLTITSCGTTSASLKNSETEVAGYTLKNKTELMEQKILNKKSKTVIARP